MGLGSFGNALYSGDIYGPHWPISDENGDIIALDQARFGTILDGVARSVTDGESVLGVIVDLVDTTTPGLFPMNNYWPTQDTIAQFDKSATLVIV